MTRTRTRVLRRTFDAVCSPEASDGRCCAAHLVCGELMDMWSVSSEVRLQDRQRNTFLHLSFYAFPNVFPPFEFLDNFTSSDLEKCSETTGEEADWWNESQLDGRTQPPTVTPSFIHTWSFDSSKLRGHSLQRFISASSACSPAAQVSLQRSGTGPNLRWTVAQPSLQRS